MPTLQIEELYQDRSDWYVAVTTFEAASDDITEAVVEYHKHRHDMDEEQIEMLRNHMESREWFGGEWNPIGMSGWEFTSDEYSYRYTFKCDRIKKVEQEILEGAGESDWSVEQILEKCIFPYLTDDQKDTILEHHFQSE